MRLRHTLVAAAAATLLAAPVVRAEAGTRYYLSLGDSLAQGYQPIGGPWSPLGFPGYNQGYPDQLLKLVREPSEQLRLWKLGCGGETTTTMLVGAPWCGFPLGSQLAEATAFLRAHRGQVSFVTIDIGGNDVIHPEGGGVPAIQANLPAILAELRAAAGPGVPIVGMNYYNPGLAEWFANPASLQGHIEAVVAVNDLLEAIYAAAGDPVADVEAAFATTDTTLVDGVPVGVARLCAWTWICTPPPHGPDIHPNNAGHAAIAQAFERALGPST
jgi:lysophospholipase L1-like esterase